MPTNKPRITFTIDEEGFERLEYYRFTNRFKNQTQAIVSLINKGLEQEETKKAPGISPEAMKVAREYDGLPPWGQRIVRSQLSELREAVEELEKPVEDEVPEPPPEMRVIPLFRQSAAAGPAEPDNEQIMMYDDYEVPVDSRADFAIRVNGTSMEPYLHDGQIALGVKRAPNHGEVGAVLLDGECLVKQILTDVIGDIILLSCNREESDHDVVLRKGQDTRTLNWIGTIIMGKKPPLPKV